MPYEKSCVLFLYALQNTEQSRKSTSAESALLIHAGEECLKYRGQQEDQSIHTYKRTKNYY